MSRRHLRGLADAPAKKGVRLVAIWLLQQAEAAFARLTVSADEDALHDFRVALRRLRSHVRSYRPWLRESAARKQERRLRRIGRASNRSRDLEVLRERLREIPSLTELEQRGAATFESAVHERLRSALTEFRNETLGDFSLLARELRVGFSTYTDQLRLDGAPPELMGQVAARLARQLRDALRDDLASVLSIEHQEEAHAARISGKRLRYLLEPFADTSQNSAAAVAELKKLQDALGRLRDMHALLTEVEAILSGSNIEEQEALGALRRRVLDMRAAVFGQIQRDHLEPQSALLFDRVEAAISELARRKRARGLERRFLLQRMPRLEGAETRTIQQGYLPGADIRERVRKSEAKSDVSYTRTLCAGSNSDQVEIEEEISERIFKQLFALTKGQRVRKRRYTIERAGQRWQVDRFLDRKLVLAEVTLESIGQSVELPRWLQLVIVREVTRDASFRDENLAR